MADAISCNACNYSVTAAERQAHYKSDWHRYNVKRQCAGLAPIGRDLFEEKLSALEKRKEEMSGEKKKYKCEACRSTFSSEGAFKAHLTSKKHLKKDNKGSTATSRANSAPPSPSLVSSTPTITALIPTLSEGKGEGKTPASVSVSESKDAATPMDGGEDGEEGEGDDELPADRIPVGTCLFCQSKEPVTFKELDDCLDHMLKHHGFFIPFIEYLVDMEGLLEYLGVKIGHDHECLYCNGRGRQQYPSLHAAREHMTAKSHCKIRFEEDSDHEYYDEYLPFYKFPGADNAIDEEGEGDGEGDEETDETKAAAASSSSSSTGPTGPTGPTRARGLASMDHSGELVLTDGSRIGHRSLVKVYRQKLRPVETRESVLIAKMMNSYKALALPGYAQKDKFNERSARIQQIADHQRIRFGSRTFMKVGRTSIRQQIGIPKKKKTV